MGELETETLGEPLAEWESVAATLTVDEPLASNDSVALALAAGEGVAEAATVALEGGVAELEAIDDGDTVAVPDGGMTQTMRTEPPTPAVYAAPAGAAREYDCDSAAGVTKDEPPPPGKPRLPGPCDPPPPPQ